MRSVKSASMAVETFGKMLLAGTDKKKSKVHHAVEECMKPIKQIAPTE